MIRDRDSALAYEPTPPGPRACARALGGAARAEARSAEHGPGVGIVLCVPGAGRAPRGAAT
jgi:hypothetical protein